MKKLALTICLVLALASVASAADITWGTAVELKGHQSWTSGNYPNAGQPAQPGLTVKATAEGDNWDATAEIGDLLKDAELGKWKASATDGNLKVTTWGKNYELSDKGTPFGFVSSAKKDTNFKMRVEYAPVTVDLLSGTDPVLYGFVEQTFDPATVGLGAKVLPQNEDATVAGYVKLNGLADMIDIKGEVGMQTTPTIKDNNAMFGIQGDVSLPASIDVMAKFVSKGASVGDENAITLQATQDATGLLQLLGKYEMKSEVASKKAKSNTLTASVKARGDAGNKSYDDQFATDKYYGNVAWGAMGQVVITKNAPVETDKPKNTITVKGTTPIIPGKAWVLGALEYTSDADKLGAWDADPMAGSVSLADAENRTQFDVHGRYILTDKVLFDGNAVAKAQGGDNYSKVGVKATYNIASAKELYAELESDQSAKYTGLKDDKTSCQKLTLGFKVSF